FRLQLRLRAAVNSNGQFADMCCPGVDRRTDKLAFVQFSAPGGKDRGIGGQCLKESVRFPLRFRALENLRKQSHAFTSSIFHKDACEKMEVLRMADVSGISTAGIGIAAS